MSRGHEDFHVVAVMRGLCEDYQVTLSLDSLGRIRVGRLTQYDVTADTDESTEWVDPPTLIFHNLNRIRNQIVAITGEGWSVVSHSIAAVWAKFSAVTGHAHSGAADDGKPVDHGTCTGLADDDHGQYFLADCSRVLTGLYLYRDVTTSYLDVRGGPIGAGMGAIFRMTGKDMAATPGRAYIYVPNAAGTGNVVGLRIDGLTDTPTPFFAGLKKGATSCADGGTVTHGCGAAPTAVVVIPSLTDTAVAVTAIGATTFTVAVKKISDGTAGTTQTVYWFAWL